jgi:hypothetical protein
MSDAAAVATSLLDECAQGASKGRSHFVSQTNHFAAQSQPKNRLPGSSARVVRERLG